jgi:uncharacterized protein
VSSAHFSASAVSSGERGSRIDTVQIMNLHNETAVNVAALLKEPVGAVRTYGLTLDRFPLDRDLFAEAVAGSVRLTKLGDEIIGGIRARGTVTLECQRCLREYAQAFKTEFDEEFRETVDVRTGHQVQTERTGDDEERFTINENHELDLAEPLRQEILVALPMRPDCGDQCPGPDLLEVGESDGGDNRFAALASLLDDDES